MRPRAALASITALLLASATIALIVRLLPLEGPATQGGTASSAADLPWPYCTPDATPPPPPQTPWPPLTPAETAPGAHGWRAALDPMVEALISPSSIVLGGTVESGIPGRRLQEAVVTIEEVVWRTVFRSSLPDVEFPIRKGQRLMVTSREIWVQAAEALDQGAHVMIGVGIASKNGYYVTYALDANAEAPEFFGMQPISQRDTAQFRTFLSWEGNPLRGADPMELLVAWNEEMDAPKGVGHGPISRAWTNFWDRYRPEEYPSVGTQAWWDRAPAECRSILDAPGKVLQDLPWADVWVHVPRSWRGLKDGAICIEIPTLGSAGCNETWRVTEPHPYLHFDEVQTVSGVEVQVTYSKEKGEAISYVEEVLLGAISFDVFLSTGAVLVELDSSVSPVSFAQLAADPNASELATSRALTQAENDSLSGSVPAANSS